MIIDIYVLKHPGGPIFYVGQSAIPENRLERHKRNYGDDVEMYIVETVDGKEAADSAEKAWIWRYSQWFPLANLKDNPHRINDPRERYRLTG